MNREYYNWYSTLLQRDMELLVFGHAGRAVLLFPTRMARFFDYENWGIIDALHKRIAGGELQVFCVDSIDAESFYNQSISPADRIKRHLQYEQYILQEVIPFMQTKNTGNIFEAAGCSMGAYHAANLALKYPALFKKLVCMSGRYDVTRQIQDFADLFNGYSNEDIYFNMPMQYMSNLADDAILNRIRQIQIILAVGETDPFLQNNKEFSHILWGKGIVNDLYIWQNYAHHPRQWKKMVQLYL